MEAKILVEFRFPPSRTAVSYWKRLLIRFFKGPFPLFVSLLSLIILSSLVLYYHTVELFWIMNHNETRPRYQTGVMIRFSQEVHKVTWLPTNFYGAPHHHLAVSAALLCMVSSFVTAALYVAARRKQKVSPPCPSSPGCRNPREA